MSDLKLPDIEPVGPIVSSAGDIERAGAQFKQAADAVGGVLLESEMADVAVQMQEAELQTTRGAVEALHQIKSAPYIKPEEVEVLFGGNVPSTIDLTEDVEQADGTTTRERRQIIPMHEVAKDLIEQRMKVAVANAAEGVKAPGWRAEYQRRSAGFVEKVRAEALDWQRAQRIADREVQSVAQFEQAMARGQFQAAENVLGNANYTMDVHTRETLRAQYPTRRAALEASTAVRDATTAEELNEAARVIGGNVERSDKEKGGLFAPLPQETRTHLLKIVEEKRKDLLEAAERAKTAVFDAKAQEVNNLPPGVRRQYALENPDFQPPTGLADPERYRTRRAWFEKMLAGEDVEDNISLYYSLAENGWKRLKGLSRAQVEDLIPSFTPATNKELAKVWGDLDAGRKPPPMLTDDEARGLNAVLADAKYKFGKDASAEENLEYELARATVAVEYHRERRDPTKPSVEIFSELVGNYIRNAPKSTVGDRGRLDMPPDLKAVIQQVHRDQGRKVSERATRSEAIDYDLKRGLIEEVWGRFNNEDMTERDGAQIFLALKYNRQSILDAAREKQRVGFRDSGTAQKAGDFSDKVLIEFLVDQNYSTPEGRTKAEAERQGAVVKRGNVQANAQAKTDAAAALQRRQALYEMYLREFNIIGVPSARSDVPTFKEWLAAPEVGP